MKSEILAPAGSVQSVIAAVNSGCNAIYIGGRAFNARRYALNPSDEELKDIIEQCHLRGVKVHITLNTLYKNEELYPVLDFALKMYRYGADAFIVQDLGFFSLAKKYLPNIALHVSTQLTAHSLWQAQTLKELGFERVVLSRELPLEEIKHITASLNAETECFVHGALCVSYSGRCLMSSLLGGRSGNRGSCAQPCRMEYTLIDKSGRNAEKSGYLLSPKDNCMIEHTRELIEAGITSWKIEGRMKSPEYVALVTSMYRKYADKPSKVSAKDMKELTQIFNRGGELHTGYYFDHSGRQMLGSSPKSTGIYIGKVTDVKGKNCVIKLSEPVNRGDGIEIWTSGEHTGTNLSVRAGTGESITVKTEGRVKRGDKVYRSFDKALNDSLKNTYGGYTRRREVRARLKAEIGKPLELSLATEDGISVVCTGAVPEKAANNPMSFADIAAVLGKTGNTPFIFNFEQGSGEGMYVPLSSLKELKREVCTALEREIIKNCARDGSVRTYKPTALNKAQQPRLSVQVTTAEQLAAAINERNIDIYVPLNKDNFNKAEEIINSAHGNNSSVYFAMPVIEREKRHKETAVQLKMLENTALDGYLIRNVQKIDTGKTLIADHTLNTFNSAAYTLLTEKLGCKRVCLSPELNLKELSSLCGKDTEVIVYGRLPLMTTQQCPVGVHLADKHKDMYCKLRGTHPPCVLRDRKKAEFPVITDCESCVAFILNSAPVYTADKWDDIAALGCGSVRLMLTTEDKETAAELIRLHKALISGERTDVKLNGSTRGHFYRGVS